MNGMLMMLKSFGIDPDELKNTAVTLSDAVTEVKNSLVRIETNQRRVEIKLDALLKATPGVDFDALNKGLEN